MTRFPKLSLQELCEKITDGTHHSPPNGPSGDFMYVTAKNIRPWGLDLEDISYVDAETHSEIYARCDVRKGDVLYVKDGAGTGTVAVNELEEPFSLLSSVGVLRPGPALLPKYLFYALQEPTTKQSMLDNVAGVAITRLTLKKLNAAEIPVAPLAEQARIVAKLEELLSDLDAGVAELKVAQKKLQQYRQSLLKAAVEGALTADWREAQRQQGAPTETGAQLLARILTERRARWEAKQLAKFKEQGKAPPKDWQKKYPEPVKPDIADLPRLPEGWVWASLDQCSFDENSITDGPFGSNLKSEHYQESGPRVIRLQNIGDGVFVDAYAHISERHFFELSKHAVEEGDVVVAMLGEILPRACCIPSGVAPAIVKADCARVRIAAELVQPELVVAQLSSKPIRDTAMKFVKGIGRPRINLGHVRSIPIALAPADEQVAIGTELQRAHLAIDEQLNAIDLSFRQSIAQRQNILRAAFRGHLVPQDPNDEPAESLLARVRSERLAQGMSTRNSRRKSGAGK